MAADAVPDNGGVASMAGDTVPEDRGAANSAIRRRLARLRRTAGRKVCVTDLEADDVGRLRCLGDLLHLGASQILTVTKSVSFKATFPWAAAGRRQWVRAAPSMYGGEWWDDVLFHIPGSKTLHSGRARLVVRAVDNEAHEVMAIVHRMVPADARPRCVLSRFRCQRMQFCTDLMTTYPEMMAVPLSAIQRLDHVVVDIRDICERHCAFSFPDSTPRTVPERLRERFGVNAFYPWTSNGLTADSRA